MIWWLFSPRMRTNSDKFARRRRRMLPQGALVPSVSPLPSVHPPAPLACQSPRLPRLMPLAPRLLCPLSQRHPSLVPPLLPLNPLQRSLSILARSQRSTCIFSQSPRSKASSVHPHRRMALRPRRTALPHPRRPLALHGSTRMPPRSDPIQRQTLSLL
jgi:hypothetical protein